MNGTHWNPHVSNMQSNTSGSGGWFHVLPLSSDADTSPPVYVPVVFSRHETTLFASVAAWSCDPTIAYSVLALSI